MDEVMRIRGGEKRHITAQSTLASDVARGKCTISVLEARAVMSCPGHAPRTFMRVMGRVSHSLGIPCYVYDENKPSFR